MKTLNEMTTAELWSLRDDVSEAIQKSRSPKDLWAFWRAIENELDRRGA